jgi:hypothetical protein
MFPTWKTSNSDATVTATAIRGIVIVACWTAVWRKEVHVIVAKWSSEVLINNRVTHAWKTTFLLRFVAHTVALMKIEVLLDMNHVNWWTVTDMGFSDPKYGGTKLLQDTGKYLWVDMARYLRRLES